MVYSLTYRRPPSSKGSISGCEKPGSYDGSLESGSTGNISRGIPDALSFNRIIEGGTCPVSCIHMSSLSASHTDPVSSPALFATS